MSWQDKVKEGLKKVAEGAEDTAVTVRLKMEIRSLHGKMEDALKAIGAKAYDLYEGDNHLPEEVVTLCEEAKKLADEIKAKEEEVEKVKAEG